MKHVQTFKNFSINEEEVFGFSSAEKREKKKNKLQEDLNKYVPIYFRKGAIIEPTQDDLDKFMADAEKDDFEGVFAIDNSKGKPGKICYRAEKDVSWGSSSGHTFGSGA
jgi:hypothetical protein